MKMSIDKCIEKIIHEKQCFIDECWHNNGELEAYDMTIETMRKYQKIEQILKDIPYGGDATLRRIQEVVEDGKA